MRGARYPGIESTREAMTGGCDNVMDVMDCMSVHVYHQLARSKPYSDIRFEQ